MIVCEEENVKRINNLGSNAGIFLAAQKCDKSKQNLNLKS